MALNPGKSPVPSSGLTWSRGDGAAAAGPGMGRVSDGSPGQPGPAGFKVTCKAQSGHMPSLPHGWRPLGLLFSSPELQTPGKGTVVLPTLMPAAQLAGDSAPAPKHSLPHTHWHQFEGHPAPGKIQFVCQDLWESRLGLQYRVGEGLPGHPPHLSSQRNTQGCSWYPSIAQGTSTPALDVGMRWPFPSLPVWAGMPRQPSGRAAGTLWAGGSRESPEEEGGCSASTEGGKLRQGRAGMGPHPWCSKGT